MEHTSRTQTLSLGPKSSRTNMGTYLALLQGKNRANDNLASQALSCLACAWGPYTFGPSSTWCLPLIVGLQAPSEHILVDNMTLCFELLRLCYSRSVTIFWVGDTILRSWKDSFGFMVMNRPLDQQFYHSWSSTSGGEIQLSKSCQTQRWMSEEVGRIGIRKERRRGRSWEEKRRIRYGEKYFHLLSFSMYNSPFIFFLDRSQYFLVYPA